MCVHVYECVCVCGGVSVFEHVYVCVYVCNTVKTHRDFQLDHIHIQLHHRLLPIPGMDFLDQIL